ncbi:MAG: restriction endonuclease subunit S [Desulfuromonadales bacterium]
MSGAWPLVALGDIAGPVSRPISVQAGSPYRTIGVKWWGGGSYERQTIDGSQTAAKTLSIVKADDLIINKIWVRHGSTAIATDAVDGCAASGEFPTFSLNRELVEPRWVHWLTQTRNFWSDCAELSRGTSGKNRIKPELFLTIHIPLPSLAEQRRIVAGIEELAAKIEEAWGLRRQAVEEAEALSRSAVETVYQGLAARFGQSTLSDTCTSITDGDHNTPQFGESGIKFIFVGNVSSGKLHFNNSKKVAETYFNSLKPHRVPARGDILYSAVGATLGIATVVDTDELFCFQRHIAILKPNRQIVESRYVWHMLNSQTVFEKTWSSTTGTAQPTVPLRAIRELPLPLPTISEQRHIVSYLDDLFAKVYELKRLQTETAAELNAMLPSILDKAFSQEL